MVSLLRLLYGEEKVVGKYQGGGRRLLTWEVSAPCQWYVVPMGENYFHTSSDFLTCSSCVGWCIKLRTSSCRLHERWLDTDRFVDTYRSVLGRLGAWLPDHSGCTSPDRSRPVRDTGQILACLFMGEEPNTEGTSQGEAKENRPAFIWCPS